MSAVLRLCPLRLYRLIRMTLRLHLYPTSNRAQRSILRYTPLHYSRRYSSHTIRCLSLLLLKALHDLYQRIRSDTISVRKRTALLRRLSVDVLLIEL